MIVTAGGIGGNHAMVRAAWPSRLGPPPGDMLCGVPAHVDGRMIEITEKAGGAVINRDRGLRHRRDASRAGGGDERADGRVAAA